MYTARIAKIISSAITKTIKRTRQFFNRSFVNTNGTSTSSIRKSV